MVRFASESSQVSGIFGLLYSMLVEYLEQSILFNW